MKTRYNDISFEKARSDPDCWGIWKTKEKMKHRIGLITYSSGEMEIKLTWKDVTPKIFNTMNFFLQQLNLNTQKKGSEDKK